MDNQLIRLVILTVLILMITSDIKDLMQALSTTANLGLVGWAGRKEKSSGNPPGYISSGKHSRHSRSAGQDPQKFIPSMSDQPNEEIEEDVPLQFYTPIPTGRTGKLRSTIGSSNSPSDANNVNLSNREKHKKPQSLLDTLTEEEKTELVAFKSHLTKVMQEWCLPKLVCELHATVGERDSLTEAEKGLLSIIKETSMNPMGEVISRYHFAAHMGQLLADVEGNGCHNFYPNCPLSGSKVLQMVKKVRIR